MRAITIHVTDIAVAKQFYQSRLGFVVQHDEGDEKPRLKRECVSLILYQVDSVAKAEYPQEAGVVVGIATPRLNDTVAELRREGVEVIFDTPQTFPGGRYNAIRDPFGNVVELLEFAGELRSQELRL